MAARALTLLSVGAVPRRRLIGVRLATDMKSCAYSISTSFIASVLSQRASETEYDELCGHRVPESEAKRAFNQVSVFGRCRRGKGNLNVHYASTIISREERGAASGVFSVEVAQ